MLITANSSPFQRAESNHTDDLHPTQARWFAVRVGHRKEKVVAKLLERHGIECFLPLRDRPFNYKSKTGVRQIPLLGGYLFVKIIVKDALLVQQQNFVFGFVKIGRDRRQVTEEEIDVLKRISSDTSLGWDMEDMTEMLKPGCLVEISRGPLAGVRGHYQQAKTKKVFIISFAGLDARLMTCEVSPDDVIPLTGSRLDTEGTDEQGKKKLW